MERLNDTMVLSLPCIARLLEIRLKVVVVDAQADPDLNTTNILGSMGLIEPRPDLVKHCDVWVATEKATIYLRWLCDVPMPVRQWIDPRDEKKKG